MQEFGNVEAPMYSRLRHFYGTIYNRLVISVHKPVAHLFHYYWILISNPSVGFWLSLQTFHHCINLLSMLHSLINQLCFPTKEFHEELFLKSYSVLLFQ